MNSFSSSNSRLGFSSVVEPGNKPPSQAVRFLRSKSYGVEAHLLSDLLEAGLPKLRTSPIAVFPDVDGVTPQVPAARPLILGSRCGLIRCY